MSFVDATVRQLRLPHSIVRRATQQLLGLLRRHAKRTDMQMMLAAIPELGEMLPQEASGNGITRLMSNVRRLAAGARHAQQILQTTGLGQDDVAFASCFARCLRSNLDEPTASRLIHSVPGFAAMSSWPLAPHIPERTEELADQEGSDPGSTPPPRLS